MNPVEGFLYGIFGGTLNEIVGVYKYRRFPQLPEWFSTRRYWVSTTLMVLVGGSLVLLYIRSKVELTPILALNIGISAPLILGKIGTESLPAEPSDRID